MKTSRRSFTAGLIAGALATPAIAKRMHHDVTKLTFAGARFRIPTQSVQVAAAHNNLATISKLVCYTPNYITRDFYFKFSGFWCNGRTGVEVPNANDINVMVSVFIGTDPTPHYATFGGNSVGIVPAGGFLWSDMNISSTVNVPANTMITVCTLYWVNDGEFRLSGMTPSTIGGVAEVARRSSDYTTLIPLLNTGAFTSNVGGADAFMYGPDTIVARSPLTARSALLAGDSICAGLKSTGPNARNVRGMFAPAFDQAGWGATCYAFNSQTLLSDGTTGFARRAAGLNALPMLPFDTIVSDLGVNDCQTGIDSATMNARLDAWINNARTLFPGVQVIHSTLTPVVTGTLDTQAGQIVAARDEYPNGPLFTFGDYVRSGANGGLDGYIETMQTFSAQNNPNTGDAIDKWRTANDTVAYTADGKHPNDLGYTTGTAAIAAQVPFL